MRTSHFSRHFEIPTYNLSPQKVTKFLLLIIALLILGNIAEKMLIDWLNTTTGTELVTHHFNFDQEANFPSLYSALALGFCSYLLAIVTSIKKIQQDRYIKHWKALSFIFLFLAIDEACSIHEFFIPLLRGSMNAGGIFYFTWVIPAFFLLIIFLIAFRKFILKLPPKIKLLFVIAGGIFVTGALGMELIGGYIVDNFGFNTSLYGLASRIEELLEMLGIVIFINALLTYIQSQSKELHFSLSFQSSDQKPTRY